MTDAKLDVDFPMNLIGTKIGPDFDRRYWTVTQIDIKLVRTTVGTTFRLNIDLAETHSYDLWNDVRFHNCIKKVGTKTINVDCNRFENAYRNGENLANFI